MLRSLVKSVVVFLTDRVDGQRFADMINRINKLRASRITVAYEAPFYVVTDGEHRVQVSSKMQALRHQRGVARRLDTLFAEYWLDRVPLARGDVIVDCGANVGLVGLAVARAIGECRYIAFEPSPAEFKCLERNLEKIGADVRNMALWHSDDTLDFFVKSSTADNSLLEMEGWDEKVSVQCRRLDEIAPEGPIKLMKIEAEGAEPEVLRGAEGMLDRVEWLTVDSGPERGFDQRETLPEVVNFLVPRGFELVAVSHGRVVALFKRKDDAAAAAA
jgi:FkbM family methyltransferase